MTKKFPRRAALENSTTDFLHLSLWRSLVWHQTKLGFVLLFCLSLSNTLQKYSGYSIQSASLSHELNSTESRRSKVLYTVTTLSEFNNGRRNTERGSDRFQETVVPILTESVRSMLLLNYEVDVYLICGFVLTPARRQQLLDALPSHVGLEIWDDALPMNYHMQDLQDDQVMPEAKIQEHTRGLSRQHRFVIKDKLPYYDIFVNFEDDMLIKGGHVRNYQDMSNHLLQLRHDANHMDTDSHRYFGSLTKQQLAHVIPGFMRVEAVLDETKTPIPPLSAHVPVHNSTMLLDLDPSVCCHVSDQIANPRLPLTPTANQLILWEVQIQPLGVRQMPKLQLHSNHSSYDMDWVVLQRGTRKPHALIDYGSGKDGYYKNQTVYWRPETGERKYLNNMGGYMATRQQLYDWHTELCNGGFLPPFDPPHYKTYDGLDLRDVEFWSGGIQLLTGCNLQRIINLKPESFSRSILYHTANNKQEQLQHVRERFTRLDDFYGMLLTVKENAIKAKPFFEQYTVEQHNSCNPKKKKQQSKKEEKRILAEKEVSHRCLIYPS